MTRKPTRSEIARPVGDNSGAPEGAAQDGAPALYVIPVPPSLNKAYSNARRGRVLSHTARNWKMHAAHVIKHQRRRKVCGPVVIVCNVERPTASSDLDNRVKLLLDALVAADAIDDDRNVVATAFAFAPPVKGNAHVSIHPAGSLSALTFQTLGEAGELGVWSTPAPVNPEKEAA